MVIDFFLNSNYPSLVSNKSKAAFFESDSLLNKNNFIEIDIVSCGNKASSCGECMVEELLGLGCGWCKSSGRCSMRKDCPAVWMSDLSDGYCADPLVRSMGPVCGPRDGAGTKIVLEGQNLGTTASDVHVRLRNVKSYASSLDTDDLECNVVESLYVKARRIVCQTKPINADFLQADVFSVYVQTNVLNPQMGYSSFNESNQFFFEYIVSVCIRKKAFRISYFYEKKKDLNIFVLIFGFLLVVTLVMTVRSFTSILEFS